jgi:glycosyltransferase involved in cell wall biosynthesis
VKKSVPSALLLLVGKGKNAEQLKKLTSELGLEDVVEFTGWVDFRLVPDYIKASSVCLVPHESNPHTDTTIPHKIFQYMLLEKPMVVTDAKPLKRIADETGCGLVVPSNDPVSMAQAICRILEDPNLQEELGKKGRKAALERYNWAIESEKLISLYEELAR